MILLILCLLTLQCPAYAKSSRTVHLADGEMEPIYVENGYSTLLKFSSHPEPGLIGDQDGFKVEYLKNIVAIKPLVMKGKTNLFIFTKDGQFNFQLVASHGNHDNVVYVEPRPARNAEITTAARVTVPVDELLTRKMHKTTGSKIAKLTLESVSLPAARTTMIFHVSAQTLTAQSPVTTESFRIFQGKVPVKIENLFLERQRPKGSVVETAALILVRTSEIKNNEALHLMLVPSAERNQALQIDIPANPLGQHLPR